MKNYILYTAIIFSLLSCANANNTNSSSTNSIGKGGSTARFTISNEYLYAVDQQDLHIFSISDPKDLVAVSKYKIGRDIETIFTLDNHMFIGSQSAVYIYDITQPLQPKSLHIFRHAYACDPVVADSNYAYVTLRSNESLCGRTQNELRLINISDINYSFQEYTYLMESPYGLGVDGDFLFVCDNGVKMFDKTNPANITLLSKIPQVDARDLIAHNNNLIVTASDGIYQYDYSQGTLSQKSTILINE